MIQRVQSIFLLVVQISMFLFLFYPIWIYQAVGYNVKLTSFEFEIISQQGQQTTSTFYITFFAVLSIILAFYSMMSYKKRSFQIKINHINSILLMLLTLICVYFLFQLDDQYTQTDSETTGLYFLFSAIICNLLATRYIRRDIKKIQQSTRIR